MFLCWNGLKLIKHLLTQTHICIFELTTRCLNGSHTSGQAAQQTDGQVAGLRHVGSQEGSLTYALLAQTPLSVPELGQQTGFTACRSVHQSCCTTPQSTESSATSTEQETCSATTHPIIIMSESTSPSKKNQLNSFLPFIWSSSHHVAFTQKCLTSQ